MKRNDLSSCSQDWIFLLSCIPRGPCVFPGLVWWKMGCHPPEIKLLTWTEIRHSVFKQLPFSSWYQGAIWCSSLPLWCLASFSLPVPGCGHLRRPGSYSQERQTVPSFGSGFLVSFLLLTSLSIYPTPDPCLYRQELTLGRGPVSTGNQHSTRSHKHGVEDHWGFLILSLGPSSSWHQPEGRMSHPNHGSGLLSLKLPGLSCKFLCSH